MKPIQLTEDLSLTFIQSERMQARELVQVKCDLNF